MKFTSTHAFLKSQRFSITLLGMSGIGKTTLSHKLPRHKWFHYSGDYRIGTRYLGEAISDSLKSQIMKNPFLAKLMRSDSIYPGTNISFSNLELLSSFLGQLGDPEKGGLPLSEFRCRQHLYRQAEINAMLDVGYFREKAHEIYGYPHFINDAGGSLIEVMNRNQAHDSISDHLIKQTLILHMKTSKADIETLCQRAIKNPKPMYYSDSLLDDCITAYKKVSGEENPDFFDPDAFSRWSFPRIIEHRAPLYSHFSQQQGYTVTSAQIAALRDEKDFIDLVAQTIDSTVTQMSQP